MSVIFPNEKWIAANIIGVVLLTGIYALFIFFLDSRFDVYEIVGLFVVYCIISIVEFYINLKSAEEEEQKSIVQQLKDMRWTMLFVIVLYILFALYILYVRRQNSKKLDDALKTITTSFNQFKKQKTKL